VRQRNNSKKNRTLSAELEPIVTGEAGAPVSVAWSLGAARACSSLNRRRRRRRRLSARRVSNSPGKFSTPLTVNSFVQQIIRRKGLLPPTLPERFRRSGHLHDQTTLVVPNGNEVVVLVKGLCLVVYGIDDDEPAAADFRCGDGLA
jgi:hypothetical protein